MLRFERFFSLTVWFLKALTVGLLLGIASLQAAIIPDLYDASLPYQTQSSEERHSLLQEGLLQVIEKISGQRPPSHQTEIQHALEQVTDYVEQYDYQGNFLKVKYSADQVNHLIYQMGQTVWGQRRPKVILWLAIQDQQQRRLIGSETDQSIQSLISTITQKRGLPLILPLMDLEDIAAVTVTDVWGDFPTVLKQGSERYQTQVILVGRITENSAAGGMWEANWQVLLTQDQQSTTWQVKGQTLEAVLEQGITGASHYLMGRYGEKDEGELITSANKQLLRIGIQNIQSAADFAKVEAYLQALSTVIDVDIQEASGDFAIFAVTLESEEGRQQLEEAMRADQHFTVGLNSGSFDQVDQMYRLVPFFNGE